MLYWDKDSAFLEILLLYPSTKPFKQG